jgi:hypothetical protein
VSKDRTSVLVLAASADIRTRWQRILAARNPGTLEVRRLDPAGEWDREVVAEHDLLMVEEGRDGPDVWALVEQAIDLGLPPGRIAVVLTSSAPPPKRAASVMAVARPDEPESLNELLLALDARMRVMRG